MTEKKSGAESDLNSKINLPSGSSGGKPATCKCCGGEDLYKKGQKEDYIFWECRDCSFIFTDISYDEKIQIYSADHSYDKDPMRRPWPAPSLEFLSPAITWLPARKLKIMDFGCGESDIPDRLRDVGHKVIGVDIMPPVNEHRDRLTGDILEMDFTSNSFDLIYSYQVFEQIAEPVPVVEKLTDLLKDNGMLLIHTNMEPTESFRGKFSDGGIQPPEYCSFFSHDSFQGLFDRFSYRIIYKNPNVVLARKI